MKIYIHITLFLCLLWIGKVSGQSVYQHISNNRIYDFLDELANEKIIALNSTIKPYTRNIFMKNSQKQKIIRNAESKQQRELEHYLDYYTFATGRTTCPRARK